jgi:hypothetical protein
VSTNGSVGSPGDDHHGSASGTLAPAIARLVAADEGAVREAIHRFNEIGLAALDPR